MSAARKKPSHGKRSRAEVLVQRGIELALGAEADLLLLRNSVGLAMHVTDDGKAFRVPYGLGNGSPDLVGILRRELLHFRTDAFVDAGVWFCLEVKAPGQVARPDQLAVHDVWRSFGAFVETVDSVEAARAALARAREMHR